MLPSSSGLSVATSSESPSIATQTTIWFVASSAGSMPSTKGEIGVMAGSQKATFSWSATAATRSRSLT
jgi:hypothetical protein